MPNFKDDKSKFTMKNMNYYKGKHAASEANSPYNKNKGGGKLKEGFMHAVGKSMAEALTETITGGMFDKAISRFGGKTNAAEIAEELVNIPVQNKIKGGHEVQHDKFRKDLKEKFIPKADLKIHKKVIQRFIPNKDLKLRKDLTEGKIHANSPTIHLIDKKDYTPQTKSRKDPSTDVTPQSQKGKKFLKSKITKLIKKKK
jgi:hypothetical protein